MYIKLKAKNNKIKIKYGTFLPLKANINKRNIIAKTIINNRNVI